MGTGPPTPHSCHRAVYSCCVLGISCHCSCDHLLPAAQRGPPRQDRTLSSLLSPVPVLWVWFRTYALSQALPLSGSPSPGAREGLSPAAPAGGETSGLLSPPAPMPGYPLRPGLACPGVWRGAHMPFCLLPSPSSPLLPSLWSQSRLPFGTPYSHISLPLSS